MCLDAVGALDIIVALEFVASVAAESHSNTSPSTIKQIALSPKLSMDHIPGSIIKSPDAASPHATNLDVFVTVAPAVCDAAVVFLTPLVTPVKCVCRYTCVRYFFCSYLYKVCSRDGNCDASFNVILVADAFMSDDKTVVKAPTSCPPQDPSDQPKPCDCTSGPT